MVSPEYQPNPSGLQGEITYSNPEVAPRAVANTTASIFNLYFHGVLKGENLEPAQNYLRSVTLKFIDNARAGLAEHPERVDRLGTASLEDLERIVSLDRQPTTPPDETLEALDYSLITMGMIPHMAIWEYKDIEGNNLLFEFSKKGMLRPPFTTIDALNRFHELWREIFKITIQETKPNAGFLSNPALSRTRLFFDTARSLPLRNRT